MCFNPLEVTASGNSAISFFLQRVTFLTSINDLSFFFNTRKSNLVLVPNFVSGLISNKFLNSSIKLFLRASCTILFDEWVFTPTLDLSFSIISNVYFNFRLGLLDLLIHTLFPFLK